MTFRMHIALAALLLAAGSASAEIYRWYDAQGREHFTTSLQAVPAGQREAARARAEGREGGNLNFHAARPQPTPVERRTRTRRPAAAAPDGAGKTACTAVKKQVRKLVKVVAYHERKLAAHQRSADDITLSKYSRRRAEIRAEESSAWLAKAEAKLDAFRSAKRREGVEPGCFR